MNELKDMAASTPPQNFRNRRRVARSSMSFSLMEKQTFLCGTDYKLAHDHQVARHYAPILFTHELKTPYHGAEQEFLF